MIHEHLVSLSSDSLLYGIFPSKVGSRRFICWDEPKGCHLILNYHERRKIILKRKKKEKIKEPVKINVVFFVS